MASQTSVQHAQPTDMDHHTRRVTRIMQPAPLIIPDPEPVPAPEDEVLTETAQAYLSYVGYAIPARPASFGTHFRQPTYATTKGVRPTPPPPGVA